MLLGDLTAIERIGAGKELEIVRDEALAPSEHSVVDSSVVEAGAAEHFAGDPERRPAAVVDPVGRVGGQRKAVLLAERVS